MHDSHSTEATNDYLLSRRAVAACFSVTNAASQSRPVLRSGPLRYRRSDIVRVEEKAEGARFSQNTCTDAWLEICGIGLTTYT